LLYTVPETALESGFAQLSKRDKLNTTVSELRKHEP